MSVPPLFPGELRPMPAPKGSSWGVRSNDPPPPPPVRHADGYRPFVEFAEARGVDAAELLDTWRFAYFVREFRSELEDDPGLLWAAVVFLGNSFVANHPDMVWSDHVSNGAMVTTVSSIEDVDGESRVIGADRHIRVEGTVPALLAADERRFREFDRIVRTFGRSEVGGPP